MKPETMFAQLAMEIFAYKWPMHLAGGPMWLKSDTTKLK